MHIRVKKAKKENLESDIAAIMGDNRINRVPRVDDFNKVIGIITRSDLIKSMIKRDM
ncbi:MAG: CBS domain-containing protein [Actinobacteria bacterium]|nr:CBS domain-containing protein [Actinomycetota bacterium]